MRSRRSLYSEGDRLRSISDSKKEKEPFRSEWRRDYARLVHCPSFRRLQGKTQVFPGNESDFYRNRLTHSLEVAQISKSIALRLNATSPVFSRKDGKIDVDITEFAGLAHDLGHPPFGHNGEMALDECMQDYGGFEGNAQTLRIVSRLEKKSTREIGGFSSFDEKGNDLRCGLNLTFRSLAALLKYDQMIPERMSDRKIPGQVMKGYYREEAGLVEEIKANVLGTEERIAKFKTVECSIMDIADDIAYSTYDLEDNLKAGFLTPMGLFALDDDIYEAVASTISDRILAQYPEQEVSFSSDDVRYVLFLIFKDILFSVDNDLLAMLRARDIEQSAKKMLVAKEVQSLSRRLSQDGYHRVDFTSRLVQNFLNGIEVVEHRKYPQLNQVRLEFGTFIFVEVLKNITYHAIIRSPGMQVVEYRGKDIVKAIFNALTAKDGIRLLPQDFRDICRNASEVLRMRTICDFIAGMTDRYAIEFYGRLYGANHLTIHKPL